MKLTNKLGLPAPIVSAIANDSYTKGHANISVTELLTPPQIVALRRQHADEITEDVSDRIWALLGQSVHAIIERAAGLESLSEATIYSEYGGWTVKGTADNVALASGTLYDFKVTTVWKIVTADYDDWEKQTNIYRRLLKKERGLDIGAISVVAILRDWSKNEVSKRQNYPTAQAVRIDLPVWSDEQADKFIEERVRLHQQPPVPCTDDDIWAKPTRYALHKRGAVRAVKLFHTLQEAEAALATSPNGHYIVTRPGEATRCLRYCSVASFCPQWAADPRRPADFNDFSFGDEA